ncbi:unnamed protein product, partial [Oikopleura dioica]
AQPSLWLLQSHKTTLIRSLIDYDFNIFWLFVESFFNESRLDGDVSRKGASRDIFGDALVRASPSCLLYSFKKG